MIGIVDDERVVRAGDELDEDLVAFQCARLSAVYSTFALSALRADSALRIARTSCEPRLSVGG
jgi:hypothetical protein